MAAARAAFLEAVGPDARSARNFARSGLFGTASTGAASALDVGSFGASNMPRAFDAFDPTPYSLFAS